MKAGGVQGSHRRRHTGARSAGASGGRKEAAGHREEEDS